MCSSTSVIILEISRKDNRKTSKQVETEHTSEKWVGQKRSLKENKKIPGTQLSANLHLLLGRKVMNNLDSILKSRDITLSTKVRLAKAMVFAVVIYGCESWTVKKAECQRIDAFELVSEKTLESPLDCKGIQPVHPKGNQFWVFIDGTDAEAEPPILWPPDAKSWLIWKNFDAGKDWGQEEKGMTEDEMVGWHHRLNGHGFGWTLGFGDGQGGLACSSSWGHRETDTTERLNWTNISKFVDYKVV